MGLRDFDIIEDLKPIGGGWRYMQVQKDGTLQRIPTHGGAGSAAKLIEAVRAFRLNEGLNMGDPERDVAEYIRMVSPNNDRFRGKGGALHRPRPADFVPLIQRLREWVDKTAPRRPVLMTPSEATERAQACIGCPQNVLWKTKCGECNQEVDYRGITMRGQPSYELDDALRGCRLHGVHLPSAVFLDIDFLPNRSQEAPDKCWMPKRED